MPSTCNYRSTFVQFKNEGVGGKDGVGTALRGLEDPVYSQILFALKRQDMKTLALKDHLFIDLKYLQLMG